MIQPLRTAHRRAFVALALVVPAILVAGLMARRPLSPTAKAVPATPAGARLVSKQDRLWRVHAIQSEFYGGSSSPQNRYVVLRPATEIDEPDLLLYWTSAEPQGDSLPAQAHLLGAFADGTAFALPPDAARPGHLVLYSLAHHSVVDTAAVEGLP